MDRRTFIATSTALATSSSLQASEDLSVRVYYGTKNQSGSKGIYTGTIDLESGTLSEARLATEAENAGFLAISNSRKYLYAVASGEHGQKIVAYKINHNTGDLTEINRQDCGGQNPCHVSVGPNDKYVVYANYTGGSCGLIPIAEDGSLKKPGSFFQHQEGSGVNAGRQAEPHPHSAKTDPSGKFIMVPDLGQDKVRIYRLADDKQSMQPNNPAYASLPPGGGPRHITFDPQGRWMYVNNELSSSVTVFDLSSEDAAPRAIQTISTLPSGFQDENSTAELLIHPTGRFLYCSNRGHHSVATFQIDQNNGTLTATGHCSSGGSTPRNFGITPDGRYVVVANQLSDNVDVLKVNTQTGTLSATGNSIKVPHCICVRFVLN